MVEGAGSVRDWAQNFAARGIIRLALCMPYQWRVPLVGWFVARVVAPVAGWRRRIRKNLAYAMPELGEEDIRRLAIAVPDNVGRSLIEIYSGTEFIENTKDTPLEGPGVAALIAAREAEKPLILATAHFGNYDVVRGKLSREGFPMAAMYRPMRNEAFQAHYLSAISKIGSPVFPSDPRGIIAYVRHLKSGGIGGILADIAFTSSPVLAFFDKPAHTALSAAEWVIKFDGVLIPVFGIRQPDGISFRIHVSEPIAHGTPDSMMQAYNDEVERMVRTHPDQWFWIHKRWKLSKALRGNLSEAELPPQ